MDSSIETKKPPGLKFIDMNLLTLHSDFVPSEESHDFSISYKVEASIIDDNHLHLTFGIWMRSKNTVKRKNDEKVPYCSVLTEILGIFNFENKIPKVKKLTDISLAANMLAILYPFLRDKVHYCFAANKMTFFLDPINVFMLLEDLAKDNTLITDLRNKKTEP